MADGVTTPSAIPLSPSAVVRFSRRKTGSPAVTVVNSRRQKRQGELRAEGYCARGRHGVTYNQMVVDELTSDETDLLFHALADATRRDIVRRVVVREQSVSSLAGSYSVSFAAIQKHVAVLERASLVTKRRRGREQIVQCNMSTISSAGLLIQRFEDLWRGRADRIDSILAEADQADGDDRKGTLQ
jgi:DNA-binding transcriptional ArsR family regulator